MLLNSRKTTHAVVTTLLVALSQYSYGEQMPPACAQLTRAFEICSTDFQAYQELTNPAAAKDNELDPKQLEGLLRVAIQKKGMQAVAEGCATEKMKNPILDSLVNTASAMAMAGGNPRRCMRAIQQIR
ncbi:hypothetical protein [Collimonas pratensis]|uniref:hypothetical protein n=1 Tax=Collimonas pratensis TaxID=279113 RepID=UPI0007848889|nr:hypothetical protein [Collimonas pratensis]